MKNSIPEYLRLLPGDPAYLPFSFRINGERQNGLPSSATRTEEKGSVTYSCLRQDGLKITLLCTAYADYPAVEWEGWFENTSSETLPEISDVRIGCTEIKGDPEFVYSNGDTTREDGYTFYREKIQSEKELYPTDGTSCNGASPFMRLLGEGFGVNIGIGWTGMWNVLLTKTSGGVSFSAGQKRLCTVMLPGEKLRTPKVTFLTFTGDETAGRNLWRSFYFSCIVPKINGKQLPPSLFMHNFCSEGMPEFTGASEENQIKALKIYAEKQVVPDYLWIDAGWYPCDGDWTATGTWHCDEKRFPHSLRAVSDKCRETGTGLLLWFEPERVRPGTELYKEHPEWLLSAAGYEDKLLDLGNKEALEWITGRVTSLIKEYAVDIYRQDFNTRAIPFWEENEESGRKGSVENHYVQGFLSYWDGLLSRNPGLRIDTCAGGGRRNDMDVIRRAVPLHYTDVGYGNHPIKQKQMYYMNSWIPSYRSHNMDWSDAEGNYTGGDGSRTEFTYYASIAPHLTDMLAWNDGDGMYDLARKMQPIWRRAADIMLSGDYYPLTECRACAEDIYAEQFEDKASGKGFIRIVANTKSRPGAFRPCPKADPDSVYRTENSVTGKTERLTGAEFAEMLIPVTQKSGVIVFYTVEGK